MSDPLKYLCFTLGGAFLTIGAIAWLPVLLKAHPIKRAALWLTRFFYRLSAVPLTEAPDGLPGIRDRDDRCHAFNPRKRLPGDFWECRGDGHYLCKTCCHFNPVQDER